MGVTEARISQIRAEAVNAMRSYFATLYDNVEDVAADAPGRRSRTAYLAALAAKSTWLTRLEALGHDPQSRESLAGCLPTIAQSLGNTNTCNEQASLNLATVLGWHRPPVTNRNKASKASVASDPSGSTPDTPSLCARGELTTE